MLSLPVLLYTQISIHAPRTGSDPQGRRPRWSAHHISIHAPRTGSDTAPHQQTRRHPAFQSTLPARGATCATAFSIVLTVYFNPRSPHGERPPGRAFFSPPGYFNPRSPHGERQQETQGWTLASLFQSTLPARGATRAVIPSSTIAGTFQSTLPARGATSASFRIRRSGV